MNRPRLLISSGIWKFARKVAEIWGLEPWQGIDDPEDVLIFGMYSEKDYDIFRIIKTKKSIFWCGSDILYMLEDWDKQRIIKLFPDVQHYTETEEEAKELRRVVSKVYVAPSFLEHLSDFPLSFKPSKTPHIFLSGHQNRQEEYGFGLCHEIAEEHPEFTFHFYGVEGENTENVIYHGSVPNEQFNEEIKNYQCGLRCNAHDGASEIIFKSALMGQYPISYLPYKKVWQFDTKEKLVELLNKLKEQTKPNIEARNYWLPRLNSYPWMELRTEQYWKERDDSTFSNLREPHRLLVIDKIKELGAESVLEVGCGTGMNLALMKKELPDVKIAGLDISKSALQEAKKHVKGVEFILGNADNLPFKDNSFDVVFTDAVLIYIRPENIEKVKSELLRVAKKAIVMAEWHLDDWDRLGHIAFQQWVRDYNKLFQGHNIEMQKITNWDSFKWKSIGQIITVKL